MTIPEPGRYHGTTLADECDYLLTQLVNSKFEPVLIDSKAVSAIVAVSGWVVAHSNHRNAFIAEYYAKSAERVLEQLKKSKPRMAAVRPTTLRALESAEEVIQNYINDRSENRERARLDRLYGPGNWEAGDK